VSEYALDGGVTVRPQVPADAWEALLRGVPDAMPSQTPAWRDAVCAQEGRQDESRLYTWPDGGQVLVPLARSGADCASWPEGWSIGGPLAAEGTGLTAERAGVVLRDLMTLPADSVYLRPPAADHALWEAVVPPGTRRNPRMFHTLDLTQGFGHVWSTCFRSSVRNKVRRAERSGLEVEHDGGGRLVADFDRLFEMSAERWDRDGGGPEGELLAKVRAKNPTSKFTAVAEHMGAACQLWVARLDGEAIAATIALTHGPNTVYWQSAMDKPRASATSAAPYLLSLVIEDACRRGGRTVHLGDAYPGTSVTRFKTSFGPAEHHTAGYWLPAGGGPMEGVSTS
jgi:hypothetical protein